MTRPNPTHGYARGRTLSGFLSGTFTTMADRMLYSNALSARGALLRAMVIPVLRLFARFLRWWSRGWLGQILGFSWARKTYQDGFKHTYTPDKIGDEWPQYRHGNIKLEQQKSKRKRKSAP